ncbi:MAG: hypothetical protein M3Q07_29165, partial [Pseudobdellovibrionaceae bacterium]|nr:hypothetical protein [Pseudobdellovibrionaceae bacterium]
MRSSKPYNDTFEAIEGFYWPALAIGFMAFLLALIGLMTIGFEPLYVVFFSAAFGWFAGRHTQGWMGGDYFMEGFETFMAKKQDQMLTNTISLAEEIQLTPANDHLLAENGHKIYGFEVNSRTTPEDFESDMYQLTGEMVYPHRLQIYRDARPHQIEGIDATVNEIRVIVILEIDPVFSSGLKLRDDLIKLLQGFARRLSNDEIVNFVRAIYTKGTEPGSLVPMENGFLAQIKLLRKEAAVHAGSLTE